MEIDRNIEDRTEWQIITVVLVVTVMIAIVVVTSNDSDSGKGEEKKMGNEKRWVERGGREEGE